MHAYSVVAQFIAQCLDGQLVASNKVETAR